MGKLHRITLPSPLGPPYTIPSQGDVGATDSVTVFVPARRT